MKVCGLRQWDILRQVAAAGALVRDPRARSRDGAHGGKTLCSPAPPAGRGLHRFGGLGRLPVAAAAWSLTRVSPSAVRAANRTNLGDPAASAES